MSQKICNIDELSKSLCKEFVVENKSESKSAFLVYFDDHYYAYINSCPHTGITLNWQEEQFFSVDGLYIQCSLHGALFDPKSGECIHGPCLGKQLQLVKLVIEGKEIYLAE